MKRTLRPRAEVPTGFVAIRGQDMRVYYQCSHIAVVRGEHRQCQFKIRQDRFKDEHADHGHILEKLEFQSTEEACLDSFRKRISQTTGLIASQMNWSLHCLESNEFAQFYTTTLELGHEIGQSGIAITPSFIRSTLQYYTMRKSMVDEANELHHDRLAKLKSFIFISLSVDRGTVAGRSFYDVFACNAGACCSPILLKSFESVTKHEYVTRDCLAQSIDSCITVGLIPVSIVADNEVGQQSAIKKIRNDDQFRKLGLFSFSCAAHTLCLVYNDAMKSSHVLSRDTSILHKTSKIINESGITKSKCPRNIPTRWLYDFEICEYIIKRRDIITDLFSRMSEAEFAKFSISKDDCQHFINTRCLMLARIMSPMRFAVSLLEADDAHIGEVTPFFIQISKTLSAMESEVLDEEYLSVAQTICSMLMKRRSKTLNGQMADLAFSLTPQGRSHIRQLMQGSYHQDFTDGKPWSVDVMKFSRKYLMLFNDHSLFLRAAADTEDEFQCEDQRREVFEVREIDPGEIPEALELTDDHGPFLNISSILGEYCKSLAVDSEKVAIQFKTWILGALDERLYGQLLNGSSFDLWCALTNSSVFQDLSIIARRIFVTPATEAVCERGFSMRKRIMSDGGELSKSDLLTARMHSKF